MKDPYAVLGLGSSATQDEIKRAFRKLAQKHHPDRRPGDSAAEARFKEMSAAYDLLSDPVKRRRFDRGHIDADGRETGPRTRRGARHRAQGNPFDRFFHKRAGGAAGGLKVDGVDVTYTLSVDFLEAAGGAVKRVSMTNGKTLDVRIPPGCQDGQVLRLKDQGMPGIGGGKTGAARVEITVRPHPTMRLNGYDVEAEVPVSLPEAVLGGRIEVETISGRLSVTVPEGANSGTVLRLRSKGFAKPGGSHGDHLARLTVVLPDGPDDELVAFVRKWSARKPYQVRKAAAKAD